MQPRLISRVRSRGFTLIELGITVAAIAVIAIWVLPLITRFFKEEVYTAIARQTVAVGAAGKLYVSRNGDSLKAAGAFPVTVTAAQMSAAGYTLPTGPNLSGQTYVLVIYQAPDQSLLPIVVSTGGRALDTFAVRRVADLITKLGGTGGFIDNVTVTTDAGPTFLQGRQGLKADLALYGIAPGAGHVGDAIYFSSTSQVPGLAGTSLQRVNTPGHPEYNQMATTLDMNGNAINNATTVSTAFLGANGKNPSSGYPSGWTGGVHAQDIYGEGNIGAGLGGTLMASMTSTGALTGQQLTVAGDSFTGGYGRFTGDGGVYWQKWGGGLVMTDANWVSVYGDKGLKTNGQIMGGTIVSNGRMATNEFLQVLGPATLGFSCPAGGLMGNATDGSGLLECRGGVWSLLRGISDTVQAVSPDSSCGSSGNTVTAVCPANYRMTGGGYVINAYRPAGTNVQSAPTNSAPSGNGWQVFAGGPTGDSCFAAYAVCAR